MPVTRSDVHEVVHPDGTVETGNPVEVDVTVPAVHYDLHAQLRGFLDNPPKKPDAWLAALTRLVLHQDGASDRLYDEA